MRPPLLGPSKAARLALLPLLVLILAAGILPFAAALANSLYHDGWGSPTWAGFENFRILVEDRAFVLSLGITVSWALLSASLSVATGFIVASVLLDSRKGFRILFAALLVPWGVPAFISVPVWRMIIHGSGGKSILSALLGVEANLLTDPVAGFAAALAVDVWLGVPLAAFAIYASLGAQNRRMTEAALMDGAGTWRG